MSLVQVGTIIAGLIAALLTMFGIIVVRGTKISEFRQKWIDEQRQDVSTALSISSRLAAEPSNKREEHLLAFDVTVNKIKLRENPKRPEWTELLVQIESIRTKLTAVPPMIVDIKPEQDQIINLARIRLKAEWQRVHRGELGYRIFHVAAAVITTVVLVVATVLVAAYFLGYEPATLGSYPFRWCSLKIT